MIVIRDDDTSYWTSSSDLEFLYGKLLDKGYKISLAVVPCGYKQNYPGVRSKFYLNREKHVISENKELVDWLTPYVRKGQIEVMQHGYAHSYYILIDGSYYFLDENIRKKVKTEIRDNVIIPECAYMKEDEMGLLREGKKILEDVFGIRIRTFVPPGNALSSRAAEVIDSLGMDISGTITNKFNRRIDKYSINIFLKKAFWRISGHDYSYPYIMKYKNHRELVGFSFVPGKNYETFKHIYEKCCNMDCPFTLATHYWELIENEQLRNNFFSFLSEYLNETEETTRLCDAFEWG